MEIHIEFKLSRDDEDLYNEDFKVENECSETMCDGVVAIINKACEKMIELTLTQIKGK